MYAYSKRARGETAARHCSALMGERGGAAPGEQTLGARPDGGAATVRREDPFGPLAASKPQQLTQNVAHKVHLLLLFFFFRSLLSGWRPKHEGISAKRDLVARWQSVGFRRVGCL